MCILDVQFVQRLDMIVDEGNGDEHEVLLAALHQRFDGLLGARLQPGQGTNLGGPKVIHQSFSQLSSSLKLTPISNKFFPIDIVSIRQSNFTHKNLEHSTDLLSANKSTFIQSINQSINSSNDRLYAAIQFLAT